MINRGWLRLMTVSLAFVCLAGTPLFAQRGEKEERGLNCNQNWNSDRASHCVIKEQTIPVSGAIDVDGKKNGGISVKGWDRNEILIRSQIQSWANTDAEAQAVANQIRIETAGGKIHAEGPAMDGRNGWAVSFEIFVPRNTNLALRTHNGGIGISDVRGQVDFDAHNGGVTLRRLAGNIKGQTVNGGLSIELEGSRWDGEGINVKTTNGGVNLVVPENYSARLETGTVNGGMRIDIPVTVQGKIEKELSVDLGSGGPTIRATTTNGGISIKRKA